VCGGASVRLIGRTDASIASIAATAQGRAGRREPKLPLPRGVPRSSSGSPLDAIRERKAAVLAPRARGSALRLAPPQSAHSWGELGTRDAPWAFTRVSRSCRVSIAVRSYSGEHARAPDQAPSSAPDRLGAKVRLRRIVVRAGASSGSAQSLANHRPSRGLPREQHPAPVPSGLHARVWRAANSHDGGPQPSSERPYPPGWRHPQRGPYVG